MKRIKICTLALSTCLALGAFSGCNKTEETTAAPVSIINTTASEAGSSEDIPETEDAVSSLIDEPVTTDVEYISFDAGRLEYANLFISDFAEQFITDIDRDSLSFEQLMDFVHIFLKINSRDSITYETNGDITYETFTFERASEVAKKHFGIFVSEAGCETLPAPPSTHGDQPAGPYYANGIIWYEASDGEIHNLIAIVDYGVNNTDGTQTLRFTIYAIDMETFSQIDTDELKSYYKLDADGAAADKTLGKVVSGTAVVGVGQSGDYYLISYKTDK